MPNKTDPVTDKLPGTTKEFGRLSVIEPVVCVTEI